MHNQFNLIICKKYKKIKELKCLMLFYLNCKINYKLSQEKMM